MAKKKKQQKEVEEIVKNTLKALRDQGADKQDWSKSRAGIARTICVIVDPDLTIPSDVPISYIMSRPNWDNAINNPMEHLK